jgi:hypothetical protein
LIGYNLGATVQLLADAPLPLLPPPPLSFGDDDNPLEDVVFDVVVESFDGDVGGESISSDFAMVTTLSTTSSIISRSFVHFFVGVKGEDDELNEEHFLIDGDANVSVRAFILTIEYRLNTTLI